jgi:hypothetical protein
MYGKATRVLAGEAAGHAVERMIYIDRYRAMTRPRQEGVAIRGAEYEPTSIFIDVFRNRRGVS